MNSFNITRPTLHFWRLNLAIIIIIIILYRASHVTASSRSHSNSQSSLHADEGERSQQSRRISLVQGEMQVPAQELAVAREGSVTAEA